ncbi:hypothetical protein NPIL_547121 [Nephila pilipes]|uniref:Uncharacterized protein n=1 Tax=Nephila pilipes TaxID=299642 RepID=A0A8X6UG60_NEPPI|nr:hypothetical protein NPIL_547121 [Nephila pilipes]
MEDSKYSEQFKQKPQSWEKPVGAVRSAAIKRCNSRALSLFFPQSPNFPMPRARDRRTLRLGSHYPHNDLISSWMRQDHHLRCEKKQWVAGVTKVGSQRNMQMWEKLCRQMKSKRFARCDGWV